MRSTMDILLEEVFADQQLTMEEYEEIDRKTKEAGHTIGPECVALGFTDEDLQRFHSEAHDSIIATVEAISPTRLDPKVQMLLSVLGGGVQQWNVVGCNSLVNLCFAFMAMGVDAERRRWTEATQSVPPDAPPKT